MKNKILVVAAHPDDEVFGLGGTLFSHLKNGDSIFVIFMSDGVTGRDKVYDPILRKNEINERKEMAVKASQKYNCSNIDFIDLPNLRMDQENLLDITKIIEEYIVKFDINIIYTHNRGDTNIDHRITHDATVIACRPIPNSLITSIRLFETCSSTEYSVSSLSSQFQPNLFIDISDYVNHKRELLEIYKKELRPMPHPRSLEAISARDIYRGTSVGYFSAECFMEVRKKI